MTQIAKDNPSGKDDLIERYQAQYDAITAGDVTDEDPVTSPVSNTEAQDSKRSRKPSEKARAAQELAQEAKANSGSSPSKKTSSKKGPKSDTSLGDRVRPAYAHPASLVKVKQHSPQASGAALLRSPSPAAQTAAASSRPTSPTTPNADMSDPVGAEHANVITAATGGNVVHLDDDPVATVRAPKRPRVSEPPAIVLPLSRPIKKPKHEGKQVKISSPEPKVTAKPPPQVIEISSGSEMDVSPPPARITSPKKKKVIPPRSPSLTADAYPGSSPSNNKPMPVLNKKSDVSINEPHTSDHHQRLRTKESARPVKVEPATETIDWSPSPPPSSFVKQSNPSSLHPPSPPPPIRSGRNSSRRIHPSAARDSEDEDSGRDSRLILRNTYEVKGKNRRPPSPSTSGEELSEKLPPKDETDGSSESEEQSVDDSDNGGRPSKKPSGYAHNSKAHRSKPKSSSPSDSDDSDSGSSDASSGSVDSAFFRDGKDPWLKKAYRSAPTHGDVELHPIYPPAKAPDPLLDYPSSWKDDLIESPGTAFIADRLKYLLTTPGESVFVNPAFAELKVVVANTTTKDSNRGNASYTSTYFNIASNHLKPPRNSLPFSACFLMLGTCASSQITAVAERVFAKNGIRNVVKDHRVGVRPFEWFHQRSMTYLGSVGGKSVVKYPFSHGVLYFCTKTDGSGGGTEVTSNTAPSPRKHKLPASVRAHVKSSSSASSSSTFDPASSPFTSLRFSPLSFDTKVPIFDARASRFVFGEFSLDKIGRLPKYKHSEVPLNSLIMVGYTANTYTTSSNPSETLSLNIQFVVLLALSS